MSKTQEGRETLIALGGIPTETNGFDSWSFPIPDDFTAPPAGANPEFDNHHARVWAVIVETGNPEGLTEDYARRKLAHMMSLFKEGTK